MKSLSSLQKYLKSVPQKKVINNFTTTKLNPIIKAAGFIGWLAKKQIKNPLFGLSVAAAAATKDPKEVINAAIKNVGVLGISHNTIQMSKELGPFGHVKEIKSIKN